MNEDRLRTGMAILGIYFLVHGVAAAISTLIIVIPQFPRLLTSSPAPFIPISAVVQTFVELVASLVLLRKPSFFLRTIKSDISFSPPPSA